MQQRDQQAVTQPPRIRPTRLVHYNQHFMAENTWGRHATQWQTGGTMLSPDPLDTPKLSAIKRDTANTPKVDIDRNTDNTPSLPFKPLTSLTFDLPLTDDEDEDIDISLLNTHSLMRLSGMMQAVRAQKQVSQMREGKLALTVQQTGPFPVINLYEGRPLVRVLSQPLTIEVVTKPPVKARWRQVLDMPAVRVILGLLVGLAMLYLISKVVDIPATIKVLQTNLTTPRGMLCALLAGMALMSALAIRGTRWRLFINPLGKISLFRAAQIFIIGSFLNFLLPIRGGEIAKSLILKRVANIPVSQSLPTVAMDKALDLMPALFIMVLVPFLGVHMSPLLWFVLGTVGGLLIALIGFIALAAWKRDSAVFLLHKTTSLIPGGVGDKIEGFATGFVDAMLIGASQPRIFVPAILLTLVAIFFEGLFAMLAFWTIGYQIPYGTALFGYMVYSMFFILPNPPGQVGSNELNGLIVFHGLLGIDAHYVTAMFLFSHPWSAIMLTSIGLSSLSALGLNISNALKMQPEKSVQGERKASPLQ